MGQGTYCTLLYIIDFCLKICQLFTPPRAMHCQPALRCTGSMIASSPGPGRAMPTSSVTWPLLRPPHIVHHHGHVACPTAATRILCPPSAARIGHVTTRSTSPQHLRSPILTFATKKLSTGANGQKEDAASFFCPCKFDRADTSGLRPPALRAHSQGSLRLRAVV